MTAQEFSMEFDVLFNNIMSGKAPGINNYEKSVFLTKAQDEILKSHFQSEGNKYKEGFNESIKRDTDFSFLVTLVEIDEEGRTNTFYNNSIRFKIPDTMFLPINFLIYYVIDGVINELIVIPMREDEIIKLRSKPYKEPFRGYAYKIDNCTASLNQYEIITGSEFFNKSATEKSKLKIRYIRYPWPIIVEDFADIETQYGLPAGTLSINGITVKMPFACEFPEEKHREILDRAVNLAKVYYEGNTETILSYSNNDE